MRSQAERFTGDLSFSARWRLYFRERFPLPLHAPVLAVFSGSSFIYLWAVQGPRELPSALPLAVAFAVVTLFFLQLRILDEFKDFSDDLRFRPYRPVPRGIVTLRGLGLTAQVTLRGTFSNGALGTLGIAHVFMPQWPVSPVIGVGAGMLYVSPKATLLDTKDRHETVAYGSLGARGYLSDRFMLQAEYRGFVVFTDRDDNEETDEWLIGFTYFF